MNSNAPDEFTLRSHAYRLAHCAHGRAGGVALERALCCACAQVFWRCPVCGDNRCLVCEQKRKLTS